MLRFFLHCIAKRGNLYFQCGKLLAVSLCNGGSVGHTLAPCIYDFITLGESNCHPAIDDVQDHEIKKILQQVHIQIILIMFFTLIYIYRLSYTTLYNHNNFRRLKNMYM